MRTEANPIVSYVGSSAATFLKELGEECQNVSKLLAQLEVLGLQEEQVDDLVADLSAAVLHLHEHTRGLDELLLEKGERID